MNELKHSYYINIQSHEIFSEPDGSEWDFRIEATDKEVAVLERLFDKTEETDWESYFRAHIPYLEYHHQPQNKDYDLRILLIYTLLHYLGDEDTRAHIREMGILNGEFVNEQGILGYREF
ncbi:hydrolase [Bacillus sp. AFS073361]|uniref:hydrolase n=1 Tax=Bacillus sp. AFS073361 TaxID=2033511 RepID=UPI000BF352CB|nr:hydrolase [Bacillus sp. AFS073361]PFP27625.1 hydrolase [Bacillus sp. AFS073361]